MGPSVPASSVVLALESQTALEPTLAAKTLPLSSVIIVNFNGRRYIKQCLRSLLHVPSPNHEIVLVDNASTDGSAEYVERSFPEVQLIRNEFNLGFGQGSNIGARRARGKYLVFLNPDTRVEPGWLQELIAALASDPKIGLATPKILLMGDPQRINACGNEVHLSGLTLCRGMGMDRSALSSPKEVSSISGAAFAIRRDLFESLGGFDEAFFLYMEDTDLSWRARLAGYRCVCVPSSAVYHDYALRFGAKRMFYRERNRYLMLIKGYRWRTLLVLSPVLFLAELITWGFALVSDRRHLASKVKAYTWIAKHWSEVLKSRRRVQALRRVKDRDLVAGCAWQLAYEQTGVGLVARLARIVFDPLFFVLQRLALAVIHW